MDFRPFVFGGIASIVAECGTFPIDTTKTRLQIQCQKNALKYRGMLHALFTIRKEEGLRALYKGLQAGVLRQATYGTTKIGIYQVSKRFLVNSKKEETLFSNVVCAVIAGCVSSSIANPTDVLKVRMQAGNEQYKNLTLTRAFFKIAQTEGVRGLWKGVIPTAQRAAIVCGVELPAYDLIKRHILQSSCMEDTVWCHGTSSFFAGLFAAVASNPVDVIRTRLMNQTKFSQYAANSPQVVYTSSMNCLATTVRNEGVLALWKGLIPNWLRLGPFCILFFLTYEQLEKAFHAKAVVKSPI